MTERPSHLCPLGALNRALGRLESVRDAGSSTVTPRIASLVPSVTELVRTAHSNRPTPLAFAGWRL